MEFKANDTVLYKKGDTYYFGKIKRVSPENKIAWVWYHIGYTAAGTPFEYLTKVELEDLSKYKIENDYAIELIYLKTEADGAKEENVITSEQIETLTNFYNTIPGNTTKLDLLDVLNQLHDCETYENYYQLVNNLTKLIVKKIKETK